MKTKTDARFVSGGEKTSERRDIVMKRNAKGFTLAELLIVVAIIAVLVAIAIPMFTTQLEKGREATDLANVRAAYAEVMTAAILEDQTAVSYDPTTYGYYKDVELKQTRESWQTSMNSVSVGGVAYTDEVHWLNEPAIGGTARVYFVNNETFIDWGGDAVSRKTTSVSSIIKGLGEYLTRLGGGWGADSNGLMSVGGASSADSAGKVTLTTTPIALKDGAEVTITAADGYQNGYFLMKYDAEKGGFVKVVDSGWKSGTVNFTVDGDGYYLVTNTKKTGSNITAAEAEANASINIANNDGVYSTAGMTATTFNHLNGTTAVAGQTMTNSTSSKTGGTISAGSSYYRGYAEVNVNAGQILSIGAKDNTKFAYYFTTENNTVLFDSGWLNTGDETSIEIPQDCKLVIQVQQSGAKMTDEDLNSALESISVYSK